MKNLLTEAKRIGRHLKNFKYGQKASKADIDIAAYYLEESYEIAKWKATLKAMGPLAGLRR